MADIHTPRVVGLYTAVNAGAAMQPHNLVQVEPGVGIPGDRYATGQGHWSDPKWPDQELTIVEAELQDELRLGGAGLRRNIVTRGVDLADYIGQEFRLGTALLRGVRKCDPCGYIETLTRPGVTEALAGRGGLRVAVIEAGIVRLGDPFPG